MSNDPKCGSNRDPRNPRAAIVTTAADVFCTVCGGQPCYLLATTALAVMQGELTNNEDLVSNVRYMQNLQRIQRCLDKHISNHLYCVQDQWGIDNHFNFPEKRLNELREAGANVEELQTTLLSETRNGDP
jgi:hypothetical protein